MKKIYFTVTNDLVYDQRMNRICSSLAANGYNVALIGRSRSGSPPLTQRSFTQKRLRCYINKGKWFYAEYNFRLFLFLLFKKMDAICAIDLDTILPCLYISRWKKVKRIYDAHELFTELKEVITRKGVKKIWTKIEKKTVPHFKTGYTVSESLAEEFHRRYGIYYKTIRNVPLLRPIEHVIKAERFILYQGAVNEGRGLEYLIPAMQWIDCNLVICGDGNFMVQLKKLIREYKVGDKVILKGMLSPEDLWPIAIRATVGIALAEKEGLNQYFALPNKFLDYIHAGLPQVTMNYPEYQKINKEAEVAVLLDGLAPKRIAEAINNLLTDDVLYARLMENCMKLREELNWQNEEKKLLALYQSIFRG